MNGLPSVISPCLKFSSPLPSWSVWRKFINIILIIAYIKRLSFGKFISVNHHKCPCNECHEKNKQKHKKHLSFKHWNYLPGWLGSTCSQLNPLCMHSDTFRACCRMNRMHKCKLSSRNCFLRSTDFRAQADSWNHTRRRIFHPHFRTLNFRAKSWLCCRWHHNHSCTLRPNRCDRT